MLQTGAQRRRANKQRRREIVPAASLASNSRMQSAAEICLAFGCGWAELPHSIIAMTHQIKLSL
jgi:hypothetical protein